MRLIAAVSADGAKSKAEMNGWFGAWEERSSGREEKRDVRQAVKHRVVAWLFLRAHVFGSLECDLDSLRCLNLLMKLNPMKGD